MKSHLATLCIALIVGYLGGTSSQFFRSGPVPVDQDTAKWRADLPNPFRKTTEPTDFAVQISRIQQQVRALETQLGELAQNQEAIAANLEETDENPAGSNLPELPEASRKDNLVTVGVIPDVADDILRRISEEQFRSLQLRNLIRRGDSPDTRQYRNELRELNRNRISLRSELGDDTYDQYLLISGQNNRVKVSSVMAGSPAELNGIQEGDVILYYDDQKIMNASDVQHAALRGDVGDLATVEILRDGNRMSLALPRGTLGVRLDAVQLAPAQ